MNTRLLFITGITLITVLVMRIHLFNSTMTHFTIGKMIELDTVLNKEPSHFGKTQQFMIFGPANQQIFVTTTQFPYLHYGQEVVVIGQIRESSVGFGTEKNGVIPSRKPMMTMKYPKIKAVSGQNIFSGLISMISTYLSDLFGHDLSSTSASLLLGIVFGIKGSFSPEFSKALQSSGLTHIIAASGMNVTLIGSFLATLFGLFLRRQLALALVIVLLVLYAAFAGFAPSIVRATIMGICVALSQIWGRQANAQWGLFLAGYSMVFFDPGLIDDIGFQLSFVSTVGLLYIKPLFEPLERVFKKTVVIDDISTTCAAQLATVPILLAQFGTYSVWSLIANALVLWSVPVLMILGGLAAVVGFIFPVLAQLLLWLSAPILWYVEEVILFFGRWGNTVEISHLSWPFIAGYYCVLIAVVISLGKYQRSNSKD